MRDIGLFLEVCGFVAECPFSLAQHFSVFQPIFACSFAIVAGVSYVWRYDFSYKSKELSIC